MTRAASMPARSWNIFATQSSCHANPTAGARKRAPDAASNSQTMPSTVIRSIRYHADEHELEVIFTTGRCYLFHEVPAPEAEAFRRARIKGRHFNRHIRNQ